MQTRYGATLAFVLVACGVPGIPAGQCQDKTDNRQPPAETASSDDEKKKASKRLDYFVTALKKYTFTITAEDGPEESRLVETPLLRWTNPISKAKDGLFTVYSRGGRPDVAVQINCYSETSTIREFCAITPDPLEMTRKERVLWKPAERWSSFKELPDAPRPAKSAGARTAQFRRMADRFKVSDRHGFREPEATWHELRLLTQPLHRYSDKVDIIDGAMFGYVLGTDPEAFLLLEVHKSGEELKWRYGLFQMTIYELDAKLDGRAVWNKPRNTNFGSFNEPHNAFPHTLDPGDPSLKGLIPTAK